ncbi:MAG: hypothetical protein NTW87_37175 [Planctomycetota bacterium]|nr:hypothetical protein [Planctomycetota bacterium]
MTHFDAHIVASQRPPDAPPAELAGAVLYGAHAAEQCRRLRDLYAERRWQHAEALSHLVGPDDERFPATSPGVIDLQLAEAVEGAQLRKAASDWWPLARAVAANKQVLRLNLPPGASTAVGVRRLAQRFDRTTFLVDPFRHGPVAGWQAQVRLAEQHNIWLTTLGLVPGAACRWPRHDEIEEAIYFTTGEVGAGKLLLASGRAWPDMRSAPAPEEWLGRVTSLEQAERALVLEKNARDLFG